MPLEIQWELQLVEIILKEMEVVAQEEKTEE